MTLFEHLAEFRSRLIKSLFAILVGTIIAWIIYKYLFTFLAHPITKVIRQQQQDPTGQDIKLVFTGIVDPFNLQLKMSFIAGLVISSPVWIYQLWRFITPGLHKNEKRWAVGFVAVAVPLFMMGVSLGYVLMPGAIKILLGFTPKGASNFPRVDEYLTFELTLLVVFGMGFLAPLILVVLNLVGLLSGKKMLSWWRYIIILTLVFAAVATPTGDPMTMSVLAVPILALLFGAVGISLLNDRRRRRLSDEPDYDSLSDDEASPIDAPEPIPAADSLDDPAAR
jgi:sec-independent protein translocase protein TatC